MFDFIKELMVVVGVLVLMIIDIGGW